MRPPDNHVHTGWSWDTPTSSTMRKACERAVDLGLPAIAFTEHLDFTDWLDDDRASTDGLLGRHPAHQLPIDVEGYFAELTDVRERFPQLRIWSGVETGEPHLFAASVGAHLRDSPVDRILGSLHSLDLDGHLVGVGRVLYSDPDATTSAMWPDASRRASRWAPGVAAPSGPVMALPPSAITTRVTASTLAGFLLAVKYSVGGNTLLTGARSRRRRGPAGSRRPRRRPPPGRTSGRRRSGRGHRCRS